MWATGLITSPPLASVKTGSRVQGFLWQLSSLKCREQVRLSFIIIFSSNLEFLPFRLPSLHSSGVSWFGSLHLRSFLCSIPPFHCLTFPCFSNYVNFFGSAFPLFLFLFLSYQRNLTMKSCILKVLSLCWPTSLWLHTSCLEVATVPFHPTPGPFSQGVSLQPSPPMETPKGFISFLK